MYSVREHFNLPDNIALCYYWQFSSFTIIVTTGLIVDPTYLLLATQQLNFHLEAAASRYVPRTVLLYV